MHVRDLNRRFDCRRTGRKRMLTGAVLMYIKSWLNGNPQRYGLKAGSWQINMILEMVRKRFKISCKVRTLRRVLRQLGFSYKKPRPILRQICLRNRTGGVQAGDCWAARRDEQAGPCGAGLSEPT